ncbi:hypothetical protein [Kocuria palustris]|uniref:hypothetical protein n=1 Tax=Kocuria palustris TaxID=71999 RepID=UPI002043B194|nr:hypothetical protein [Kocuria palustris]MCM3332812.1 hypothetical protein [Kocuria palustris]
MGGVSTGTAQADPDTYGRKAETMTTNRNAAEATAATPSPAAIREHAEGFLLGEIEALSALDTAAASEHLAQNGIDVDDGDVWEIFTHAYNDAYGQATSRLGLP